MATQDFLPQDDSNFIPIRYYTALDPYYYTVDNRPLEDIEDSLKDIRKGGGDAARRASVINSLSSSMPNADSFTTLSNTKGFSGLGVYQVSVSSVKILPGSVYDTRQISTTIADTIVKQAILTTPQYFTITAPATVGNSQVYTVEGEFIELTALTMGASTVPYLDSSNQYLPSTLMTGELKLTIISGSSATTGTEVPAATTSGKFPLYNITIAQGASAYTVALHTNAPYRKGLSKAVTPIVNGASGATSAIVSEIQTYAFPDGSTKSVLLPVNLTENNLNPYLPIKLKFTFTPTVTAGNVNFRIRYKAFSTGELISVTHTTSSSDVFAVSALADGVQTFTTISATVPTKEFSGFVSNNWQVNKEYLNVILERVGADGTDTNTGDIRVISITLFQ